jgi:hypothetical protein
MATPDTQSQDTPNAPPPPSEQSQPQQWTPPPPDPELMGEIRKGYTPPDLKK